jgi:hypothetical protein
VKKLITITVMALAMLTASVNAATVTASEYGPTIPPNWEIVNIEKLREGFYNPSLGRRIPARFRWFLQNRTTGQIAVWLVEVDSF